MLDKKEISLLLEKAYSHDVDFCELFFEDKKEFNINYNKYVNNIVETNIYGVGIYLIKNKNAVYLYTNQVNFNNINDKISLGINLLNIKTTNLDEQIPLIEKYINKKNSIEIYPYSVETKKKINLLKDMDKSSKEVNKYLNNLDLSYFDTDQNIIIANTEGLYTTDRRISSRVRLIPTISNNINSISRFYDFTKAKGFEAFNEGTHIDFLKETILNLNNELFADDAPGGYMPIVLEGGSCTGTFFHEACGHQLETTALLKNGMFWDKRGEKIASKKVTLIDDGSLKYQYGSSKIDDEGMPRQENILIENGILKSFLTDRLGALKLNLPRSASGRRQSYQYAPASRMSNTYLATGEDDEDEMISSLEKGLYVTEIGGGSGGEEFSLIANKAFLIEKGKITKQVKSAILLGRGDQTMLKIDRVGKNMIFENSGSFCGSISGLCPTTTSGPRMRISGMIVGGKGDQ